MTFINALRRMVPTFVLAAISATWAVPCVLASDTVFTTDDLLMGTTSTQIDCARTPQALWVVVDGKGDCIRYYGDGIAKSNDIVFVYFHGDNLFRRWFKDGRTRGHLVPRYYRKVRTESWLRGRVRTSTQKVQASRPRKIAMILMARPGVFGSSGDHKNRRQPREIELIDAALTKLKQRYSITAYALAGLSGGGHIVGSMLARRRDIRCAAIGAGVVAVAARIKAMKWPSDATGYKTFYDPIRYVDQIALLKGGRVFVVGDPRDAIVPFRTQELYYKALRKHGIDAHLLPTTGTGRVFHNVADQARLAAINCAYGDKTSDIIAAIPKFDAEAGKKDDAKRAKTGGSTQSPTAKKN